MLSMTLYRKEREKYAKHRNKAQKYPSKYASIIIDGMDQDKTDVPHIIMKPKSMAGAYTLETHVTGIRAHGQNTMMVIDCGQFPHDGNLTIEIILRMCQQLVNVHVYYANAYDKTYIYCVSNRIRCPQFSTYRWIIPVGIIKINMCLPFYHFWLRLVSLKR